MAGMADRRNALLGALVWWYLRRTVRRRAAAAVGRASSRRGGLRAVAGAVALVGVLAAAFVVWRRLVRGTGPEDGGDGRPPHDPPEPVDPSPSTPEAVAA